MDWCFKKWISRPGTITSIFPPFIFYAPKIERPSLIIFEATQWPNCKMVSRYKDEIVSRTKDTEIASNEINEYNRSAENLNNVHKTKMVSR